MADEPRAIVVVGGGIIGLSVGWRLARAGREVLVLDADKAGRASWAAAGMLAPDAEVGFENDEGFRLGRASLASYPRFLADLAEDSGRGIPLDERGTVMVGFCRDDSERMRRIFDRYRELEIPVEWLSGGQARDLEPLLSPKVTAAIWLRDESQVNNRAVVEALRVALERRGGRFVPSAPVTAIDVENGGAVGVLCDGRRIPASAVVLAAGCWSGEIEGVADRPPVRPVKGQIVSLRMQDLSLARVIRAPDVYLLPKDDGRVVVGATQEEMGFDTTPTAGAVMRLLERAFEAVPSIYDLPIESIDVGLRPASRDHEPIIGPSSVEHLYYATGHFRNGILLAPVTADGIRDLITESRLDPLLEPFRPTRFKDGADHARR